MTCSLPVRRQTRFPVHWPVLYAGEDFLAEGTVLDLTAIGWRIAGPMPVHPGMRLRLKLSPRGKAEPLWIEDATVVWGRGQVFGIEVNQTASTDEAWLTQYLEEVLGLWLIPRAAEQPDRHRLSRSSSIKRKG